MVIVADPTITTHIVELEAKGAFGRFTFMEDVAVSEENRKTGKLVAMAMVKSVRQLASTLVRGSLARHTVELRKVERLDPLQPALGEHFKLRLDQFGADPGCPASRRPRPGKLSRLLVNSRAPHPGQLRSSPFAGVGDEVTRLGIAR